MTPALFLGIDGGATKTAYALADARGEVIRRLSSLPSNPFDIGMPEAQKRLRAGIDAILGGIPRGSVSLFAGLSGGISGSNRQIFADFFAAFGFGKARNGSDLDNAVAASLGGRDGVCVILGTGSVTTAVRGGVPHRFGGYGFFFDDTLSGFDLGRCAVAAALRDAEGSGPRTLLSEEIAALCGGSPAACLSDIYSGGKARVASFAPAVFAAADRGDAVAYGILRCQAEKLCAGLGAAAALYPGEPTVPLVCIGGLCARADLLGPVLRAALGPASPWDLSFCTAEQVTGALVLAGAPPAGKDCHA